MFERLRRGAWMDRMLLMLAVLLFAAALIWPLASALALTDEEQQLAESFAQGEVIRLHVVANSDDAQDQAIKLQVRDAVLEAFGEKLALAGAQSSEAAYALLLESVTEMETLARMCAREHGFAGAVHAEAGVMELPEKYYGHVLLPAGQYRALRIVLGEGDGQNWWCVLFPQLCLALSGEAREHEQPEWSLRRIVQSWTLCPVQTPRNML